MVHRRDRDSKTSHKKGGGGVLMAIKKSSQYRICRHQDWENSSIEDLWVTITPLKGKSLHINAAYIPSYVTDEIYKNHFTNLSAKLNEIHYDQIMTIGDYNSSDFSSDNPLSNRSQCLLEFMDVTGVTQSNKHKNVKSNNLLDLIFTNFYHTCEVADEPLAKIDDYHPPLVSVINLKSKSIERASFTFRPFRRINYKELNERLLEIDWANELKSDIGIDESVDKFYDILTSLLDLMCPIVTKRQSNEPRWIKRDTLRLKREKRKAHARWKKYSNNVDYHAYNNLRRQLDDKIKSDHDEHIGAVEESLKNNPKEFWSYVNNRRTNGLGLADFITWKGEVAENKKDVANVFAKRFAEAFSHADPQSNSTSADTPDGCWNTQQFPLYKIHDKLKALDSRKAAGPDGLPPILFKNCANSLTFPIVLLFNWSLRHGVMPARFKQTFIIPIYKNGSTTDAENYRPVAKLSVLAKIFDSLIADELFTRFSSKISIHQHGFFRRRSIVTNLASYTEYVERSMAKGGQTDTIYTDFSSAFDKVPHNLLIKKLNDLGVGGTLLKWFSSYLKGRIQQIQIGNVLSDEMCVPSSVIQGSHSGPILFALFVNDLTEKLDVDFAFYADDLKLYRDIFHLKTAYDFREI